MDRMLKHGIRTPWGAVQYCEEIIPGLEEFGTAAHGGVKLSRQRNARVPDYLRREGGWYEEDCEWAIPYMVFADELSQHPQERIREAANGLARKCLRDWLPDAYERFTGETIQPGDSHRRDRDRWYADHAEQWVVISAFGDWHEAVPAGMVGCWAVLGKRTKLAHKGPERFFLVPKAEYDARGEFGFVIDAARHEEIPGGPRPPLTKQL